MRIADTVNAVKIILFAAFPDDAVSVWHGHGASAKWVRASIILGRQEGCEKKCSGYTPCSICRKAIGVARTRAEEAVRNVEFAQVNHDKQKCFILYVDTKKSV